ncbi:MAG: TolC family protein [Thermoguttaceae bacterium]|nr:TolC family protein [Thermoguttaceae bacterium]
MVVTTRETIARAVVPNAASSAPASTSSLPQTTASPGAGRLETLEDATRIAISESRVRRALALKNGASRSTVEAARSLKNPKITNATSYVGVLNQPAAVSDVDLTSAASGVAQMIPGPIMDLISPLVSQIPTNYQIETPLCDKDFVTTVTAVTIPIYLGGRVNALTRAAEAMAQATQAGEEVGEQAVKIQVSEAYFLVLRTRRLHQVAVEAVETARSHRDDAERMFNVGLIARNVVLAANVALAEASQLELKVANARQLAEAAYNRLLWRPLDAPVLVADMELGAPLGDLETLTAQAVRARAELQVLSAESRALQEQEKVARADALPQVVATGAYSYIENSHLSDNSNATAAVGMVWTPFDGGTSRARQRAARQNAMAVAQARDEAESGIRLQVRQAWLAEQEARRRVEVAKAAVEQAEENLRVVTRGFQEGTVNHTETLDAATMRTTATSAYANALYDAILATQRLRYAVGIL